MSTAQLCKLLVDNYRSIGGRVEINFPSGRPLVLLGENNSGKSNVIRALNIVLGTLWPGTYEPEDNEFFKRDRLKTISIEAQFRPGKLFGRFSRIMWRYRENADDPIKYRGEGNQYIRNEDRDTCTCIVLEAERRLSYQLSYASKYTYLSRLMHRFHKAMLEQPDVQKGLQSIFEETKKKFAEIPEFANFVNELQKQMAEMVASMSHRLDVDFEAYNPVNFFQALRLQASEAGEPRALDEMGTGEQQILAMAFAHAYAKAFHGGILLVLEEPEAHLHPLAQRWLASRLNQMCEGGLQIIVTTHSPAFIDITNLEGLALVRKELGETKIVQISIADLLNRCTQTGAPPERTTAENILPFYAANATNDILEGFFAKLVVLVEGPTESLSLPIYLKKCGLDLAREGVAVIAVHGKGNLGKWRRLFVSFGIECYIIFDNDAGDDSEGRKRLDALRSAGLSSEKGSDLLGASDWVVEAEFAVFGADFEKTLRQFLPGYVEAEAEAKASGIDSKPFAARFAAERISYDAANWSKFDLIKEALKQKLPPRTLSEGVGKAATDAAS
jgi:putative ATP-dependent endonuclease of OLD family